MLLILVLMSCKGRQRSTQYFSPGFEMSASLLSSLVNVVHPNSQPDFHKAAWKNICFYYQFHSKLMA